MKIGVLVWALQIAVFSSIAVSPTRLNAQVELFFDSMETGDGWSFSHFGGTSNPISGVATQEADFGFDYSVFGIPEAPSTRGFDSPTRGLRLAANLPGNFGGDQIAAVYEDSSFSGKYTLQVDAWLNWSPGLVGTLEHGGVFAGFDLANAQNGRSPGMNGAGLIWSTDTNCGECAYVLFKDGSQLDLASGQYSVTDFGKGNQFGFNDDDVNTDVTKGDLIDLPAFFPSFDLGIATSGVQSAGIQQPAGVAAMQWVTITIEVDANTVGQGGTGIPGLASIFIENANTGERIRVGAIDNSIVGEDPVNLEGGIGVMLVDFFGGPPEVPELAFALFDNVRVSAVPEPSSFLLVSLAICLSLRPRCRLAH